MRHCVFVWMDSILTSKKNLVASARLKTQEQQNAQQMANKVYNATWQILSSINSNKYVNALMDISSRQVHHANFVVKEYNIVRFVQVRTWSIFKTPMSRNVSSARPLSHWTPKELNVLVRVTTNKSSIICVSKNSHKRIGYFMVPLLEEP